MKPSAVVINKYVRLLALVAMTTGSSCLVLPPEVAAELEPATAIQPNHFRVNHHIEEDRE